MIVAVFAHHGHDFDCVAEDWTCRDVLLFLVVVVVDDVMSIGCCWLETLSSKMEEYLEWVEAPERGDVVVVVVGSQLAERKGSSST